MPTLLQLIKNPRKPKIPYKRTKALKSCPQKKGVCLKVYTTKPKKPNSAIRKVAKLRLSTGRDTLAYIPGFGHNLSEHSVVMIRGGRVRDVPGMHYRIIRKKYDFTADENILRGSRRSKFGVKKKKY